MHQVFLFKHLLELYPSIYTRKLNLSLRI